MTSAAAITALRWVVEHLMLSAVDAASEFLIDEWEDDSHRALRIKASDVLNVLTTSRSVFSAMDVTNYIKMLGQHGPGNVASGLCSISDRM